jgi:hypothetical protein
MRIIAIKVNARIEGNPRSNLGAIVWGKIGIGRNESGDPLIST